MADSSKKPANRRTRARQAHASTATSIIRNTRKVRTIRTDLGEGSQDYSYTEILKVDRYTCRIHILRDYHDFQSRATAEVWSTADLCWNFVASIHYSRMATQRLDRGSIVPVDNFRADRNKLVEQLLDVLG